MPVFERPVSGLAFQTPSNEVGDVLPLLFGGRGDARYGLPVGHSARGGIADGEDLQATCHRQVGTNDHSTRTIRRSTQPASRGRRLDPCGPDDGLGRKGLAAIHHAVGRAFGDRRPIGQYVYGGFQRCAYAFQKFHSDTERILATVLEREARRWFRMVSGQFNSPSGVNQPEYTPDFVVALEDITLMIETKKVKEVSEAQESEADVKAKADQAVVWCKTASDYALKVGGKPWAYLVVPQDAVAPKEGLHNSSAALLGEVLMA